MKRLFREREQKNLAPRSLRGRTRSINLKCGVANPPAMVHIYATSFTYDLAESHSIIHEWRGPQHATDGRRGALNSFNLNFRSITSLSMIEERNCVLLVNPINYNFFIKKFGSTYYNNNMTINFLNFPDPFIYRGRYPALSHRLGPSRCFFK